MSYSQAKFDGQAKFGFLRDGLKSDHMLLQSVFFRKAESYDEIKQARIEYADNLKMMEGPTINSRRIFEARIYASKWRISV